MRKQVQTLVQSLSEVRKSFKNRGKDMVRNHKDQMKRVENFYCFLQEALSLGYVPNYCEYDLTCPYYSHLTISVKNIRDFSAIHKLVGTLEQCDMSPKKDDGRCREVVVTLKPKDSNHPFNFLRFKFDKKLPKGSKCKVVKRTRVDHVVQCGI